MADYLIQDTTLDGIADAINAKTGGSSAMTPAEMATAIGNISSADPWEKFVSFAKNELTSIPALDGVTSFGAGMFKSCSNLRTVDFSNITQIGSETFYGARLEGVVVLPKAITFLGATSFRGNLFTKIVFKGGANRFDTSVFEGCTNLEVIDTRMTSALGINAQYFYNTSRLNTMILRQDFCSTLDGVFPSSCGLSTSGSIYVPASLVESYKTATNWSTYADRILQIEGSIYETQYADGSPISTT